MTNTVTGPDQTLRKRAENNLGVLDCADPATLSPEGIKQLFHELRVHQIELEMQNEELRRTQNELERSRARYFDLYDLAPVGYLTLSQQGLIQEANLAAATMLGVTRSQLFKEPFSLIILKDDQDSYYLLINRLLKTSDPQACELRLVRKDGAGLWAHLAATVEQNPSGYQEKGAADCSKDCGHRQDERALCLQNDAVPFQHERKLSSGCRVDNKQQSGHQINHPQHFE